MGPNPPASQRPLTGEPDAGDPPVRFGGRGSGRNPALPTPITPARRPRVGSGPSPRPFARWMWTAGVPPAPRVPPVGRRSSPPRGAWPAHQIPIGRPGEAGKMPAVHTCASTARWVWTVPAAVRALDVDRGRPARPARSAAGALKFTTSRVVAGSPDPHRTTRRGRQDACGRATGSPDQQQGASPCRADALRPVTKGNGVAARRGRKQLEVNDRSAG
jgi:hypothetical protein